MRATVREADLSNPADGAAIVAILDSYASDEIGGGEPLSPTVRQRLVAALRQHPTTLVLLAEVEARPVGVAVCFFGFSTFKAQPLLNIHDLAVLPDTRGRGVGRALLEAAQQHAERRNCCKLTLEVLDRNHRARGLYRSFGFTEVGPAETSPTWFLGKVLTANGD